MAIIEAVLWDMDGVLVDSERLVMEVFVDLMNARGGIDDPEAIFKASIGLNQASILELYRHYFPIPGEAESVFEQIAQLYRERMANELVLKPGVIEALDTVKAHGLPQMVVTSTRTETAKHKLDLFNLRPYFEGLIGGDQVTRGKPHPEPYLAGCERLAVRPENTLVIEDSPNGVRAGLAAGCAVIHVPDLIETDPEWVDDIYEALDSLESFPGWFNAQRQGDWV